jgi:hypothetical protein
VLVVRRADRTERRSLFLIGKFGFRDMAMKLEKLDLTIPAIVHWRNPLPHEPNKGDRKRRFTSIVNAVRFVMEDLTDFPQSTAWITTDSGDLTYEEIRLLHAKL